MARTTPTEWLQQEARGHADDGRRRRAECAFRQQRGGMSPSILGINAPACDRNSAIMSVTSNAATSETVKVVAEF